MNLTDYASILQPRERAEYLQERWRDYYLLKFALCERFAPKNICEIGVRYGYSAFAFLSAAPTANYVGLDIQDAIWGGRPEPTFPQVNAHLRRLFPGATRTLIVVDSQELDMLPAEADFVHIDGDHTYEGCLHDLEITLLSLSRPGVILVDDYTPAASEPVACGVADAVHEFIRRHGDKITDHWSVDSLRGEYVFEFA